MSHLVTAADLAHEPLVNTVTVTGTDSLNHHVITSNSASVHITTNDQPGGDETPTITVTVSANTPTAQVGDTITFTYRLTNTGEVTITTVSTQLEDTAQTAAIHELAPSGVTTGTVAYVVPFSDWPGPLKQTVTVTVTASNGQSASKSASVTLPLRQGATNLPLLGR